MPVLLAAVLGTVRFRWLTPPMRYLAATVWFTAPLNFVGLVYLLLQRNNLFLMPPYAVIELLMLGLVYREALQSARFTRWMPWVVAAYAAYVLLDCLFGLDLQHFHPAQQVVHSVLILMMAGLYFRKLLTELRVPQLRRDPMFWVSVGLVFFCLGYVQIALFSNYMLRYSRQMTLNIWMVNSLLIIVMYCCYCFALCLPPKK